MIPPSPPPPAAAPPPPSELFAQGEAHEKAGRARQARAAYRQAAEQNYGPALKKMWELTRNEPGSESESARWQKRAFDQKIPGVPEPKGPLRL